jgi:DNA-binding XRE family transcriptional regulator
LPRHIRAALCAARKFGSSYFKNTPQIDISSFERVAPRAPGAAPLRKTACDKNTIGGNIKKLWVKLNLTQDDLARKSGVKYTTLSKIESGVVTRPTVHIMARIAKALGVSIKDLI